MYKSNKLAVLIALVLLLTLFSTSTVVSHDQSINQTDPPPISPYDIAVLPLDDVPDPGPDVYRNLFPPSADYLYAQAEVLRVLKDPRSIPLDHFLYYKDTRKQTQNIIYRDPKVRSVYEERNQLYEQVVSYPETDLILERFKDKPHSAIAVYVRVVGNVYEDDGVTDELSTPESTISYHVDPFYVPDPVADYEMLETWDEELDEYVNSYREWTPWRYLAVLDPESDLALPCMPQQVINPGEPYENPVTGEMIDPAAYLPPKPWYLSPSRIMDQGEVREGWLLCLAPDVPVEEIKLVKLVGDNSYTGSFSTNVEDVVWIHPDSRQMGEWHLLPDMEVVGWNGPVVGRLADFNALDLHEVYRGDVWISIASAFTNNTPPGLEDAAFSGVSIQFQFPGMNDLLQTWEHVALKEWLSLEICFDRQLSECVEADQHFEPDGTMIEVPNVCPDETAGCPDTHQIETRSHFNSVLLHSPGAWIEIPVKLEDHSKDDIEVLLVGLQRRSGDLQTSREVPGRTPAWHLEPQEINIPKLTTHTICEEADIECIPEDINFTISGEIDTTPPSFDGPIPITPFGQSANGIRVVSARLDESPILELGNIYDLDIRIEEANTLIKNYQWIFIQLEIQGFGNYEVDIFHEVEEGVVNNEGGLETIFFENDGPYLAVDYFWITQIRRSEKEIGLSATIPYTRNLDHLSLILTNSVGGGPAYELPWSENYQE
jgi:hypothetical protein